MKIEVSEVDVVEASNVRKVAYGPISDVTNDCFFWFFKRVECWQMRWCIKEVNL